MFSRCDSDFNYDRHLIMFMQDCVFYSELSRQIAKVPTFDLPTAGVAWDPVDEQVTLYYNPNFLEKCEDGEIKGLNIHEFDHVVGGHITVRRMSPHGAWNVATDLAINSKIKKYHSKPGERYLPKGGLIPGEWPVKPDGRELSKEEKDASKLSKLISEFPEMMASEWYFEKIMEAKKEWDKEPGNKSGQGNPGDGSFDDLSPLDDHGAWDAIDDDVREMIENKVKSLVKKAVDAADQSQSGWGSIPAEIRQKIRDSVNGTINWRDVLRQFFGMIARGDRTSSIKRINRRYPMVHPGIKRSHRARILVARDESGSVSDEMISAFSAELKSLNKRVEIDFVAFDCYCNVKDVVHCPTGNLPQKVKGRTRQGGTSFQAPTDVYNDPKNCGRWDALIIMTDGECSAPSGVNHGKRAWVLAPNKKLAFESDEIQIFIDKSVKKLTYQQKKPMLTLLKCICIFIAAPIIGITFGTGAWAIAAMIFDFFNSIPMFIAFNLIGIIISMTIVTLSWREE